MATLNILRRDRDNERGQAIIEMALTLPLLLLVVLGIFDFGLMFQRYEVVTNAAREGARVGVLPNYTTTVANNRAIQYLDLAGVATGVAPRACGGGLSPGSRCAAATFSATTVPAGVGAPAVTINQVVMVVEYDHEHVFVGPIRTLFGGTMGTTRLRSVSTMRLEAN